SQVNEFQLVGGSSKNLRSVQRGSGCRETAGSHLPSTWLPSEQMALSGIKAIRTHKDPKQWTTPIMSA
ncbi:hypothetical protein, partial [Mesorhizobium sp. M5C.F.Ca.IN.020.29.1.1]|uniref:hypothetical protein n=1 Tax=Mesorhizobium sp. M5C.F.Ca.IN.020.29.1.1 TaxID=2496770 RepID=UPI0019D174FE